MSKDLLLLIEEVALKIQPILEPIPERKQRIAKAHIYGVVRSLCKVSYKEADPRKVKAILKAIEKEPNADLKTIYLLAKKFYQEEK